MSFKSTQPGSRTLRVAFLSSFVPRECGIATFAEDVYNAVGARDVIGKVLAMTRPRQRHSYDKRVIATVREDRLKDYIQAALMINAGGYDVVSVQHEFGIYGGDSCEHLLTFLEAVQVPVVTTLHTVLQKPTPQMRRLLHAVAQRSNAMIVMNGLAIELLKNVYGVNTANVYMIHHGAPVVLRGRQYTAKSDLKLHGHSIISTFGLLSSGKGLEYVIQAMPRIAQEHPNVLYLILGQTHPVVKQGEGERYRDSLRKLARKLGVDKHVRFVDKYFTKAELIAYLLATDVYLTPYLNMEQVTSGTLAYAMACGRPLVSTPYLYAQFLLGEDRGILVPPRDPDGLAEASLCILNNPELKARMEQTNWRYGQTMIWPRVGQEYLRVFQHLIETETAAPTVLQARV